MNPLKMSEAAYTEFKQFLEENNIDLTKNKIRINLAGIGWGGPMFNIVLDEQKKGDLEVKIDAITFLVEEQLVNDYEGFVILSSDENNGRGLSLKPVLQAEGGGCSTCSSCH